jgi:hypothetical protein
MPWLVWRKLVAHISDKETTALLERELIEPATQEMPSLSYRPKTGSGENPEDRRPAWGRAYDALRHLRRPKP